MRLPVQSLGINRSNYVSRLARGLTTETHGSIIATQAQLGYAFEDAGFGRSNVNFGFPVKFVSNFKQCLNLAFSCRDGCYFLAVGNNGYCAINGTTTPCPNSSFF